MIYSCFNQQAGGYDYFEDSLGVPVNGDLPVPQLPPMAGQIGVPALQAGRPLPSDARHVGRGILARGILVDCGKSGSLSGDSGDGTWPPAWRWAVAFGLAGLVIWAAQSQPVRKLVSGG
jgi:hypothetical protein